MVGEIRLSPRSRLRYACRQREVTQTVTARTVNIAYNQIIRGVLRRSAEGACLCLTAGGAIAKPAVKASLQSVGVEDVEQ